MNKIAFIYADTLVYWNAIVMALAVLTGILFFWAVYYRESGDFSGAVAACPIAIILSVVLARVAHWYFRPDSYESLAAAMTDFHGTGYALMGAFAGCFLTAVVLRLLGTIQSLPVMLDSMSIGGCAAIALGRLSGFFLADDRGMILSTTRLPWAFPVINETSGLPEYRFATFLFQAIAAGCIFAGLLRLYHADSDKKKRRDGDICLLFLLFYCASQIVLDSTRYDALHLRSNGFVGIVQILCALGLVLVIGIFSLRLCKATGMKTQYIAHWLAAAAALTCGGFMEYFVQRHGDKALLGYIVMSICLCGITAIGVMLRRMSNAEKKRPRFLT